MDLLVPPERPIFTELFVFGGRPPAPAGHRPKFETAWRTIQANPGKALETLQRTKRQSKWTTPEAVRKIVRAIGAAATTAIPLDATGIPARTLRRFVERVLTLDSVPPPNSVDLVRALARGEPLTLADRVTALAAANAITQSTPEAERKKAALALEVLGVI
jgi:hypothetical protein